MTSTDARLSTVIQAERQVLGDLALDGERVPDVAAILQPEDFRDQRHERIFAALLALDRGHAPIDFVSMQAQLEGDPVALPLRPTAGWASLLVEIGREVTSSAHVLHHARTVARDSMLRSADCALSHGLDAARSFPIGTDADPAELTDGIAQRLLDLGTHHQLGDAQVFDAGAVANEVLGSLDRPDQRGGIETGLLDLDSKLAGLLPGELAVVGARPGVGKTALALQVCINSAGAGKRVLLVSLEMPREQLMQRMLSNLGGVDSMRLRRRETTSDERSRLDGAALAIHRLRIGLVDGSAEMTLGRLRAIARRRAARSGLDLLVIDYLQLLRHPGSENRWQEVGAISRGLKILARELRIPVLACAQLSRAAEGEGRPRLSHLREAGGIEQDADVVILLCTDDSNAPLRCEVAKHRSGETGEALLKFNRPTCRITDVGAGTSVPFTPETLRAR